MGATGFLFVWLHRFMLRTCSIGTYIKSDDSMYAERCWYRSLDKFCFAELIHSFFVCRMNFVFFFRDYISKFFTGLLMGILQKCLYSLITYFFHLSKRWCHKIFNLRFFNKLAFSVTIGSLRRFKILSNFHTDMYSISKFALHLGCNQKKNI